jgi:hypothetical protein
MDIRKSSIYTRRYRFAAWGMFALGYFGLGGGLVNGQVPPPSPAESTASTQTDQVPVRLAPTTQEFNEWVEQLGSSEYRVREQATDRLSRCESRYIEDLRKVASEQVDIEIRHRCVAIADSIYEVDVSDRARAFLMNAEPTDELDFGFKGWKRFSELLGDNRLMKRLFVDFAKRYPSMAESEMDDAARVTAFLTKISLDTSKRLRQTRMVEVVDTLALQLCAIQLEGDVPAEIEQFTGILARSGPYSIALSQSPFKKGLRRLTAEWSKVSLRETEIAMQLALDKDIPEILPVAITILGNEDIHPDAFELAIAMVTRFGNKDHLPLLAKWCNDERIHSQPQEQRLVQFQSAKKENQSEDATPEPPFYPMYKMEKVEVRYQDVAIASYLYIAKRDVLSEYYPRVRYHPLRALIISSLGYSESETKDRGRVVEAWKAMHDEFLQAK